MNANIIILHLATAVNLAFGVINIFEVKLSSNENIIKILGFIIVFYKYMVENCYKFYYGSKY